MPNVHDLLAHAWSDVVFDAVGATVALLFGALVTKPLTRMWRQHRHTQQLIADRLDTSTPGGLHDVVKAIDSER